MMPAQGRGAPHGIVRVRRRAGGGAAGVGNSNRGDRRRFGGGRAGMAGAAAVGVVLLAGGGAALADRISARLLREDAKAEALAWAARLSARVADPSAPTVWPAHAADALAHPAVGRGGGGGVVQYKVFDRRGYLVFVSGDPDRAAPGDLGRAPSTGRGGDPVAARLLAAGDGTHAGAAADGATPLRPAFHSEAYAPVVRDGAVLGVVGVRVDQTARRSRYEAAFWLAEALTGALVLAAGLLPLGVARRQARERRDAEARRALLAREVDHRAKNALAVVQSVLRLTPKGDAAAYARAVEGRVAALARAHGLLAEAAWAGVDLRVLADRELAPYAGGGAVECGGGAPVALLRGPSLPLAAAAVQPLAVLLHELATNAAKHGALSVPGGRVLLLWRIEEDAGLVRLRWAESGGPPIAGPPSRRGFGSKVMDATARGQLGGTVAFDWADTGLVADVALPLGRVLAPSPPGVDRASSAASAVRSPPARPVPASPPRRAPAAPGMAA
jgi:two-component sensor histidine kinase